MNAQTKIEAETLIGALAKALPELESAKKNKPNPAFKSKYADLAAMIAALEPLREHGLWFRQHSHESEAGVMVETFYIHQNGEQLSAGTIFMPAAKKDAQGFGSALTYARRYALQTAFGLAVEDDDGNAASRVSGRDNAEGRQVSPPGAIITDEQYTKLQALMQATSITTNTFCQVMKCDRIESLPADKFPEAEERLNRRLAELAKAETNEKAKENA